MAEGIEVCWHVKDGGVGWGVCANLAKGALQNTTDLPLTHISTNPLCEVNHSYHNVPLVLQGHT